MVTSRSCSYSNRTRACVPYSASERGKKCKNVKYKKVKLGLPHDNFANNPIRIETGLHSKCRAVKIRVGMV